MHIPGRAWLKVLGAFALAALAVILVPRLGDPNADAPAAVTLLGAGAVVGAATSAAMYGVLRHQLRLRTAAALYAAGFVLLVVAVKFVLGPLGLYELNRDQALTQIVSPVGAGWGTLLTAGVVGALYVLVFWIIYRIVKRRAPAFAPPRRGNRKVLVIVLAALIVATVVLGGGAPIVAMLVVGDALGYLSFVVGSSVALLVGIALAIATTLVALLFREAGDQQAMVGDASLLVSVFWLGLIFLALYHVLWVVYILILATLWPLWVVTPK